MNMLERIIRYIKRKYEYHYVIWENRRFLTGMLYALVCEWDNWKEEYFIPSNKIQTVFDVGCDYGSTMLFFDVEYGIKNFIINDIDKLCIDIAMLNSRLNDWNIIKSYSEPFNLDMLYDNQFDLMKMDIEGGEEILLSLPEINFPLILEVHNRILEEEFRKRKFIVTKRRNVNVCTMNNLYLFNL